MLLNFIMFIANAVNAKIIISRFWFNAWRNSTTTLSLSSPYFSATRTPLYLFTTNSRLTGPPCSPLKAVGVHPESSCFHDLLTKLNADFQQQKTLLTRVFRPVSEQNFIPE
jgi:hypothetical protein